jgi:Zn-dependent protease with chaperone function
VLAKTETPRADPLLEWSISVPLVNNRFSLWDTLKVVFWTGVGCYGCLGAMVLFTGGARHFPWGRVAVGLAAAVTALGLLMLLGMLLWFRNRFEIRFVISGKGIAYQSLSRRARLGNRAAIIGGLLLGSGQVVGGGLLAASRESGFYKWTTVRAVNDHPAERVLSLRNRWRCVIRLFCSAENYESVRALVRAHLPPGAVWRGCVIAAFSLLLFARGGLAQVSGVWDGGEAFGRMTLSETGSSVSGSFALKDGRILGSLKDGILDGIWTQESSSERCDGAAQDGRYFWGHVVLRFNGNSFDGGWSYCDAPAALDGSAAGTRIQAAPAPALVPVTSTQELDDGDYHLKIAPGWAPPASARKGKWVFTYVNSLKNGPPAPVTRLHVDLFAEGRPYSSESELREAVEEFRTAMWRGTTPAERVDTMKIGGVKADRFMQKGTTGWRFYLFPYSGAKVYGVYVFSPGDKPELAPEALQLLSTLKLPQVKSPPKAPPPKPAEKAPKDYLKNVGGGMNFFSEDAERELGLSVSSEMNQQLSLIDDAAVQSYIESLGQRLVAASRRPDLQCHFFVVNTREVNAFALPGCFVYVNRALIDLTQSEGQLAGVVSHEIGHVIGRHGGKMVSKQLLILGLFAVASEVVSSKSDQYGEILATAGGFGVMLAKLKYNRDDEHQADALGVETMAAAGYDPHDLVEFFRLLEPGSQLDMTNRIMGILGTHPVTADREKVLAWQIDHMTFRGDAESSGLEAFQNCRAELGGWPQPPDADVTLANALAATGTAGAGDH